MPGAITVAPATSADEADWRRLWAAYLAFLSAVVPEAQTALTWSRALSPDHPVNCFIARDADGNAVGFVVHLTHHSSWLAVGDCYLEDLFVAEGARGLGVGRALIDAVRNFAIQNGNERLYWMTETGNTTARRLYDAIAGPEDGHVRYRMRL